MKLLIKIPSFNELLISPGQEVDFDTPFIKTSTPKNTVVPISTILGFPPDKIFLNLKKLVGDKVKKGDVVGETKSFMSTKQYVCEIDGIIKEINHQSGSIVIESVIDNSDMINCFFKGTVITIHPDVIELKVNQVKEYEIIPPKKYTGGTVAYHTSGDTIKEENIINKFICAEELHPFDQTKIETLGARGFIMLYELKKPTSLSSIKIKTIPDFKEIQNHKFPYCIMSPDHTTMYFYE